MSLPSYKKIEFISPIQKDIVRCEDYRVLVNGCAGSRKTDTLVKRGFRLIDKHNCNLLFLTLVSSVSDEIKQRMEALLKIDINKKANSNHFLGKFNNNWVEIANFDAWVHKQLSYDNAEILKENADCHSLKTHDLLHRARNGKVKEFVLKNDEKATAILVDEFQDLSNIKVQILMEICRRNPKIRITCVGDYLQTIFQQAVCGDNTLNQKPDCGDAGFINQQAVCGDAGFINQQAVSGDNTLNQKPDFGDAGSINQQQNETLPSEETSNFCHPMDLFKTLKPTYFQMDICYRCPSAQLAFVNEMMEPYQKANDLKPMKAFIKDDVNKPFLFPHGTLSKNHDGQVLARQVKVMLEQVMEYDKEIKPADVAIIMRKSNNQPIFEQMKKVIGDFFYKKGFENSLCHFETRFDGYHNTIDWNLAEGKAVMISIHGDKGKGHKVVFFLGLTQKSIPDESAMFKKEELIYQSLANVALTRSTRYLFVGFTLHYPSYYLTRIKDRLPDLCFCSWLTDKIDNEFYKKIAEVNNKIWFYEQFNPTPKFDCAYRNLPLNTPTKALLAVSDDISKDLERPSDIMPEVDWKKIMEKIVFGKQIRFETKLSPEGRIMMGVMAELIFFRKKEKKSFIHQVKRVLFESQFHFTEDERLLNLCYDFELNQSVQSISLWNNQMERLLFQYKSYFSKNKDMLEEIKCLENPKYILHQNWSKKELYEQFRILVDKNIENEQIPSFVFWNFALIWNDIHQKIRKPLSYRLIQKFQEPLDDFHQNITDLITLIHGKLSYQVHHNLRSVITDEKILRGLGFQKAKEVDKVIFEKGYIFGINGISDFIWDSEGMIIEMKASSRVDISNEWIIQALLYGLLGNQSSPNEKVAQNRDIPLNILVVNIMEGKAWGFHLKELTLKMRKRILKRIMDFYQFHPILKDTLYLQFKQDTHDLKREEIKHYKAKLMDWLRVVEEERAFFRNYQGKKEDNKESELVVEF